MLTPIDIQNHVLKSTMGGYNKKETDDFIESIQVSYEQLYKENSDLKKKITTLSEGIQYYKQMEGTLQKTLVLAEQTASETLETSKTAAAQVEKESRAKADVMLAEAKARADALVAEAQEKADTMTTEAETKATALKTESEETAQRVTREAEDKASSLTRDAEEKARTMTREAEEKSASMTREAEDKLQRATREADEKVRSLTRDAEEKSKNIMYNANERAERIMADTKAEAAKIIQNTKAEAEAQIAESNKQIADLTKVVRQLMTGYEEYKKQFTTLINKQLALLEEDKYNTNLAEVEKLLGSQQVTMAEQQAATAKRFDNMTEHTKELDRPVEDTAPAGAVASNTSGMTGAFQESQDDILAGGLSAGEDFNSSPAEQPASASVSSLDIDTPFSNVGTSHGIDVSEEEATVAYKPEAAEEEASEPTPAPAQEEPSDDLKSKMNEIDSIASEALKDAEVASNDPFASVNSMLGTSYDDEEIDGISETVIDDVEIPTSVVESAEAAARSVIAAADTAEPPFQSSFASNAAAKPEPEPPFQSFASNSAAKPESVTPAVGEEPEIPPTTTDELPTVQEAYDAETYVTNETYFGSADNMTYSIPDPSSENQTDIQSEEISASDDTVPKRYDVPMPDFSKMDTPQQTESSEAAASNIPMPDFSKIDSAETPAKDVPMPDFSSLNDIAAEAMASLKTENPEAAATAQNDNYYGAPDDNDSVPYSSATDEAAAEFENGISGIDPTGNGLIPPAQNELFTAPSEFNTAPPADDEYAVTGGEPEEKPAQEPAKVTPFTFYDADK